MSYPITTKGDVKLRFWVGGRSKLAKQCSNGKPDVRKILSFSELSALIQRVFKVLLHAILVLCPTVASQTQAFDCLKYRTAQGKTRVIKGEEGLL